MLRLIRGRNSATPLRVLVLHDCAVAAERLIRELENGGTKLVSQRVSSEGGFLQALRNFGPDVVLAATTLTTFNVRTALQLVQAHYPIAALILVTDTLDEQSAVACLRAGAENVVLESNLSRLGPVTQTALAVRQPLRKLSRRQLQVVRLVAEGLTSREIAAGLRTQREDRGDPPGHGDEASRRGRCHGTGALRGEGRTNSPDPVLPREL